MNRGNDATIAVTCAKDCVHFPDCVLAIECQICSRFEMRLDEGGGKNGYAKTGL